MPPASARRIASRFVASSLWMRTPPTAPAPKTISETWMPLRPNVLCFMRTRSLLDTRARLLHDVPEPVVIGLQLPGEFLGRHVHGIEHLDRQLRNNVGIGHRFLELGVELVDDRFRRPGRRETGEPRDEIETLHGFPDGGEVRKLGGALF